jgi:hypothetical protein
MIVKMLLSLRPGDEFALFQDHNAVQNHFRVVLTRNLTGAASKYVRVVVQDVNGLTSTPTSTVLLADSFDNSSTAAKVVRLRLLARGSGDNWRTYVGSSMSPDGLGDTAATSKESRGEVIRFCWKPKLPVFWMKKYYPLFLHSSGWRLRCVLDPNAFRSFYALGSPTKALASDRFSEAKLKFDYQLDNLRLGVVVYDFHSSINKEYVDSYKSQKGLMFPFRAVHYSGYQIPLGAGQHSVQIVPGVRSARNVVTRMTTNEIYSSSTLASHYTPCLSAHPGLGLIEYQYSSGSLTFPQRPVELDDQFHLENRKFMMTQTKKLMDRHEVAFEGAEPHNAPANMRLNPWNMNRYGTIYYGVVDSTDKTLGMRVDGTNTGLMTSVLSREVDGRFAGLDLSVQSLKLDMTFSDTIPTSIASNRVLHTFIYYDSYLHVSEATGITILF